MYEKLGSTIGVVQFDPYDIEKDRGPDPNVVKHRFVLNGTWDIPVGRDRPFGSSMPIWADAIIGGWTVSTIFQARSGPNLTPFFVYGTDPIFPANTGIGLDGIGMFGESWRPDVVGDPNSGGSQFYIMIGDAHSLDGQYADFGRVTSGQDVADKIAVGDKITEITIEEK